MQGYLISIFIKQSTSNIFLATFTFSDSNTINQSFGWQKVFLEHLKYCWYKLNGFSFLLLIRRLRNSNRKDIRMCVLLPYEQELVSESIIFCGQCQMNIRFAWAHSVVSLLLYQAHPCFLWVGFSSPAFPVVLSEWSFYEFLQCCQPGSAVYLVL